MGYFSAIRQVLRRQTVQVLVFHPDATDPRSLVQAAVDKKQSQIDDESWLKGDTAWAVFDGDEHIQANPVNWSAALELAEKKKKIYHKEIFKFDENLINSNHFLLGFFQY